MEPATFFTVFLYFKVHQSTMLIDDTFTPSLDFTVS